MRNILLFIFFAALLPLHAQSDWQKWGKSEVHYTMGSADKAGQNDRNQEQSVGSFLLNSSRSLYNFFISDLDGDNCPFQPTCSSFFIESVKATNLFQGVLMFADRFTRDMNLVKINQYPFSKNYHFYDPVSNYMLLPEKIRYIPPSEFANE